jgi:hypothetical protein
MIEPKPIIAVLGLLFIIKPLLARLCPGIQMQKPSTGRMGVSQNKLN